MGFIIFEVVALLVIVGFLVFLMYDDRKNRLEREREESAGEGVPSDETRRTERGED